MAIIVNNLPSFEWNKNKAMSKLKSSSLSKNFLQLFKFY